MWPQCATILLVDDQAGSRYTVAKMLQRARYHVTEAATGKEALRLVAEKPDLVILDVGLPDLSGYEVCQRIKADPNTSAIPVLHLSASFAETENRVRGLVGGADGYLTYPVEPLELLANVQALLRMREAERQVRENRELLHVTLSSIADGVISTDINGRITFMNPVAQHLTGWNQEEALGRPLEDVFQLLCADTGVSLENPIRRVVRDGLSTATDDQKILVGKNGLARPVEETAAPIRDARDNVIGVVLVVRDVSQRRLAQQALHESEERFRVIFNNTMAIIYLVDSDSRFLLVNRRFEDLFQVTNQQVAGKTIEEVFPQSFAEAFRKNNQRVLECRAPLEFEEVAPLQNEVRTYLSIKVPLLDPEGMPYAICGVSTDITERRRLAELLRERADVLAQEGQRKDEFLAMLAHELRNPLAPIRNAVQLIRMAAKESTLAGQAGDMIERQVQHMTRLVDDLLDVSRVSRGKIQLRKERVDLKALVVRAIESARPAIDARSHELRLELPRQPVCLEGDPTRLVQIVANLLTNAAKYTDPGGCISLFAEQQNEFVEIRVKDTGIGIAPDALPQIFELFAQLDQALDRSQGGLGIGLTLVKSLVEIHGGSIRVQSELGVGSEFIVRLPALAETADTAIAEEVRSDSTLFPSAAQRRRILIVDDNVDAAVSLAMLLQVQKHEVAVAHNGKEAVEAFRKSCPEIVLLDIGLPGPSGYEVAQQLQREAGDAKVLLVALTGYGQDEDRKKAEEAGFDAHLTKPVDPKLLLDLLTRAPLNHS